MTTPATPIEVPLQVKPYYVHLPIVASPLHHWYKVFVDEDAVEKYNTFKGNNSPMVRDLQAQGKNLPLLRFEYSYIGFPSTVGTVFDTRHTPGEVFDKKRHTIPFCEISKKPHGSYWTYSLKFKLTTMHIYLHRKYPITDFIWKGKRYRWVYYGDLHWYTDREEYSYSLFLLDDKQPSLADGAENGRVHESNKLLTGAVKTFLFGSSSKKYNRHAHRFNSSTKIGQLTHTNWRSDATIHQSVTSVFSMGSDHPVESLHDVDVDLKIFLIMALIFQHEEEQKERQRRNNSSGW